MIDRLKARVKASEEEMKALKGRNTIPPIGGKDDHILF